MLITNTTTEMSNMCEAYDIIQYIYYLSHHERRLDGYVKVGRRRVHLHIMMHMVVDMLPVTGKNTNPII